jgi:hypothetical protein
LFSYVACLSAALVAAFLGSDATAGESISVELSKEGESAVIVVRGLPEETLSRLRAAGARPAQSSKLLTVFAGAESSKGQPAVLGTVLLVGDQLVFRPRFPLKPGLAYRVVLSRQQLLGLADGEDGRQVLEQIVCIEKEASTPAVVAGVYPSGDVLPENLLKFYVHFSAPMAQGDVYRHVRIVNQEGQEVDYPFVQLGQELWDRSSTRVTLLLDPGRIKRGLRPREELGPILEEGSAYELVIDRAWPDAHGRPLAKEHRKAFRVVAPDDVQPDPSQWRIDPPAVGTLSPLSIGFQEPLDHAMLSSAFVVLDAQRSQVAGRIQVGEGETRWQFIPETVWVAGDYNVIVDAALEDRSGNSIERPFEVDVFERVETKVTEKRVAVPFQVR